MSARPAARRPRWARSGGWRSPTGSSWSTPPAPRRSPSRWARPMWSGTGQSSPRSCYRRTRASPSAGASHLPRLPRLIARPRNRAGLYGAAQVALPFALAAVAAGFYSAISIFRHDRFASGGYDLGIFDQTIWGYSRFEIVRNTVKGTPNLLGDHFHPALMALAPAYWIWDDARVLLVAQALLLAAASLPIFYWGRSQLGAAAA